MKKLIVVVLALMLLIAIYGFSEENSIKAEPFETEEFKCAFLSEDTIEITSYKAKNTDVVIPAQINGYSVVSIGSRAFSNRRVETVVMPDSITTIGDYAFTNSRELEKVTLSKNIKVLGEGAFCRTNLKSITIPDSIETISGNPFEGCAALSEIVISPNHPKFALIDDVLFDKVEKRLICYPGALTKDSYDIPEGTLFIGDYAFYMCGNLKKITIPQGTASIGEGAFASCAYLKTMVFPDSLTTIENEAFANCWSLTNITIPDGVATIGEYAFNNCMYLRAVRIPDSVKMIGKDAFKSCDMLTLTIGSNAYAKEYAEENGIEVIVETEKEASEINDYEWVPLTENTAMIKKYIGEDSEITIPESIDGYKIVSIGRQAFSSRGLKTVVIPDSVETIEDFAFTMNKNLEKVTLSKNLKTLGEGAFCMAKIQSVALPDSIETIYGNPFQACGSLNEIIISPVHPKFVLIENVLFDREERKLICYPCGQTGDAYEVPGSTLSIGDYAFRMCEKLSEITLPETIKSIGKYAFNGCEALKSIVIPDGVKVIEESTFQGCASLTEIIVPDGVTYIGKKAFRGCKNMTSVTIPDSVETISNDAFSQSENITIIASRNSYAVKFAEANGIPFDHPKATNWLSKWWK